MAKKTGFYESARENNLTWVQYVERLLELSVSMFEWKNLPDTVDSRYIELQLFYRGSAVYFKDNEIGDLCLSVLNQGKFDVYGEPINRRAYSRYNNYQIDLNRDNSVIIWNNLIRTNSALIVRNYAKRLYELDRIVSVNVKAQKTPVLLQGSEQQRLTLKNLYKQYDGNEPFIFGDKNLDINSLKALKTDAPYIADRIQELKMQLWNEVLTYLGISNINIFKKERMITDEVQRNMGGTMANRYSRLTARQTACEKINRMFGTNISCEYREDFNSELEPDKQKEGEENE